MPVKSTLKAEISKLTLTQKMKLADALDAEIRTEIEAMGCPPGIMHEDDPRLPAELARRMQDAKKPAQWLTLDQLMAKVARLRRRRKSA